MPSHLESYYPVVQALTREGADVRALLSDMGLDPDAEVGVGAAAGDVAGALIACGLRTYGDGFAVRAGAALRLPDLGVYGYTCLTAPDVASALARSIRYRRLVFGNDDYTLTETDGSSVLSRRAPPGDPDAPEVRGLVEMGLAEHMAAVREGLADGAVVPSEVRFAHAPPADASAHRRVFGDDLVFGAPHHALVLPRALLVRPLRHGHPALAAYFAQQADTLLRRVPESAPYTRRVRSLLADALADGVPEAAVIARRLGTSPRTLARRLREEGTRYRALVDGVRRDIALDHLARTELALAEVAYVVGFSEPSAFYRAVKRWTGHTPVAVRAEAVRRSKPAYVQR